MTKIINSKCGIIIAMLFGSCLTIACDDKRPRPECIPETPEQPGVYSKNIGTVKIGSEDCQVSEIYEKYGCNSGPYYSFDTGCHYLCRSKILTHLTTCPSKTIIIQ